MANFADKRTPERLNSVIQAYSEKQFLVDLQELVLTSPLGQTHSYSSTGTEVLAFILEQIYGQDYEVILDGLTDKLNMSDTTISLSKTQQSRLAIGYHLDNLTPAPAMSTILNGAAGNMKSTTADMLNYLKFQLDKSDPIVIESHKVLFKASSSDRRTAYKWNLSDEGFFGTALHHHGGVSRAQNYILIAPEKDFGLFIITNQSGTSTPGALLEGLNGVMADIERHHTQQP